LLMIRGSPLPMQSKLTNPAWVKPDWAFIEEGLEVPHNQADWVEQGVLGEHALGFGKGYFIHGTLYTRLLGKMSRTVVSG